MNTAAEPNATMYPTEKVRVSDYTKLKAFGLSPAKAAECVLDANRGDFHAMQFVKMARAFDAPALASASPEGTQP